MTTNATTWLVTLTCTHCSAPGRFVGDQLIAICQYCGRVISAHRALASGHDNLALAECRAYVAPTLADVRRLELADLKYASAEPDPELLYAVTCELAALDAIEAGMPADQAAGWARWSASIEQVATFEAISLFTPSVEAFTADPAGYTQHALAEWTRVYGDIVSHPRFPAELATAIAPDVAAMDALLSCLKAWVMFATFDAISDALRSLGHRPLYVAAAPLPCRTCGAPLTADAVAMFECAYCRSAIEARRHLWLDGILRTVAMANVDTLVARDRAAAAIGMLTAAARISGNAIPAHVIDAYLVSVEGIERGAVAAMAALMLEHHSLTPAERVVVDAIVQRLDRVPVSLSPPPGRRRGNFVLLEPSEAWRRAMQRNWRRMLTYATVPRDQIALVAVNQLLPPLAGGYLPDPGDAAAFLRWTGLALDELGAGIALHASGEDDVDKAAFWRATAALVT